MQNRYVGDVGDFGKYGLLRALCRSDGDGLPDLSLGVVWHLFPDEQKKNDGKFINYLKPTPQKHRIYRICDPPLYDALARIVNADHRNIIAIREGEILPAGTVFYEEPLTFAGSNSREERETHRRNWARCALEKTSGCDIVFFDPDNGLQPESVKFHYKFSPKYVFIDELKPYRQRGQSLIIYQHMNFSRKTDVQIQDWLRKIAHSLGAGSNVFALRYHRGTARAFLVVPAEQHKEILSGRSQRFLQGPWKRHFELVTPE